MKQGYRYRTWIWDTDTIRHEYNNTTNSLKVGYVGTKMCLCTCQHIMRAKTRNHLDIFY